MRSVDAVDTHYRTHIGDEPEYYRFVQKHGLIGLMEWPKGSTRLDVHFYATLGLHGLIHGNLAPGHGFELFTGVDVGTTEFRSSFAMMANDLVTDQTIVQSGEMVSYEGGIIDGLPFTSWLMLERPDDLVPDLPLPNGAHVKFLDATPIFLEEAQHLKKNGLDALFEAWEKDNPRLSDLSRPVPQSLL